MPPRFNRLTDGESGHNVLLTMASDNRRRAPSNARQALGGSSQFRTSFLRFGFGVCLFFRDETVWHPKQNRIDPAPAFLGRKATSILDML